MRHSLDEVNRIIAKYGLEPVTYDEIMEYAMNIPGNTHEDEESFRRLCQRIAEEESLK
jgi:hypothetical protein